MSENTLDELIGLSSAMLKAIRVWISDKCGNITKSLLEVVVTVGFTFIPFFILSIKWRKSDGDADIHSGGFFEVFWSYWQAGEIVLPILGLCGVVTALLALNAGYFAWWIRALVALGILVVVLGGGAALSERDGFDQRLNSELIDLGFVCYGVLAFIWFLLAATVRVTEPELRKSNDSAQKILDEANARRGQARN